MALTLANARYLWQDGYPLLAVDIDGVTATFGTEWKPTLRQRGLVVIPDDHPTAREIGRVRFLNLEGNPVEVFGASDDARLVELFRRFWESADKTPGPVPIPDVE